MQITRIQSQNDLLVAARSAHRNGIWDASYAAFSRASAVGPLGVDDLDAMATAAWWLGHDNEAVRVGELVYLRLVRTDLGSAAIKAAELGVAWLLRGDVNMGRGWLDRARRLLADIPDGPALAYLTYVETVVAIRAGDDALVELTAVLDRLSPALDVTTRNAVNAVVLLDEGQLERAGRLLGAVHGPAGGQALYQLGELRRQRGDLEGASAAYAEALALGFEPPAGYRRPGR